LDEGLRALGYEIMLERTSATGSGIISFRHATKDCKMMVSDMRRHKITAAPRQGWVRVSPHFYISSEDIEQVLRTLAEIGK
jgi:selenocysteine lyase/cysteine desulfurase